MQVPLTVRDFLDRALTVYPDRVAVVDEPDQPAAPWPDLTFAELARRARAQAAGLDALGIGVGERVAMVSHNSARLLSAFFGVSGWGRVLVPINFRLVAEEVRYIVEHSGASILLVDPELEEALAGVDHPRKLIIGDATDDELFAYDREPQTWAQPDESATATINYTSGTTARPKGVQLTHRNLWLNASTFGWHTGVSDRDVYLHTLPMFHCNGWGMPYATVGMGVRQIVIRKIDGAEILRRIEQHRVTLLCAAPSRAATGCASWSPARRPRARPSNGSRRSWAGSSSRSTGSPRRRRCSPSTAPAPSGTTSTPPSAHGASCAPAPPPSGPPSTSTTTARSSPGRTSS
jgi:acyl-CoA synthetase (AMP-forming)/AMP-acid ligase II